MKQLFRLFISLLIPVIFISCETDFEVRADYKEVAIIYGLLNQNDSIHYLRINKAFLGDGDALIYAQNADSSSYGAEVEVVLTEIQPSGLKKEIVFDTVTLYNKEEGVFYSPGQLFYYSTEKLNEDYTYDLRVKNKQTGYEASSQTLLIHDFGFSIPADRPPNLPPSTLDFRRASSALKKFKWYNAVNGKKYQLRLYFNYKELSATGDTSYHKIEWLFPDQKSESTTGNGETSVDYYSEDFYTLCEKKIPYNEQSKEDAVSKRIASFCELELTVIGDEFNTYLDASLPSTGLLLEKPSYSNITNGLGLLSCRFQIFRSISLNNETIFDLNTTTDLKFVKPN